jgi:hypothetical protein
LERSKGAGMASGSEEETDLAGAFEDSKVEVKFPSEPDFVLDGHVRRSLAAKMSPILMEAKGLSPTDPIPPNVADIPTFTWPPGVKWKGDAPPTLTVEDVILIKSMDMRMAIAQFGGHYVGTDVERLY